MSGTDEDFVQTSNLIILRNWDSVIGPILRINKKLKVFQDPNEIIRLKSELWFDDSSTDELYTCNYTISLGFNTNFDDSMECTYEVHFYLAVECDDSEYQDGEPVMDLLFECEKVRKSDAAMEFNGKFDVGDNFFLNCDMNDHKLFAKIKRRRWKLASIPKTQQLQLKSEVAADKVEEKSEENDVHRLQSKLQQGLERQIEMLQVTAEKQKKLQDLLDRKMENLHESQISNVELDRLREIEHNLLEQLQESEQKAQAQVQGLKDKIKQLEINAKGLKAQHKIQMDELTEWFKCCVCCVNKVNVVWVPCGHAKFCAKCVSKNRARGVQPDECMICRQTGSSYKLIV